MKIFGRLRPRHYDGNLRLIPSPSGIMLFPDAPYSALWSQSTCHRLSQISAVLCLADFGFIIWTIYRRKRDVKFNLFHFFGLLFTSCRLAGDYVDLRYFYHLTHPDGWGWCLFIFVFVVRLVIFLASIAVLYENEDEPEDSVSQASVAVRLCWGFWVGICGVGSWGLWIAFAASLMMYDFIFSFVNRLVFLFSLQ
jgi:heme/copper-type cytochrome/quinol oxidase subunit 4